MRISAQLALGMAIIFAVVCFGVAYDGFTQLDAMTDANDRSDARGYALFWLFLGAVGLASGVASWWIVRRDPADRESRDRRVP